MAEEKPDNQQVSHDSKVFSVTDTTINTPTEVGEVPVLSYHQVRNWSANDAESAKPYIIPVERFKEHMKMLHDSGYHTILPDELVDYLLHQTPLPSKPIVLTFDDGTISQYTNALPELDKYGFRAVFFIMTVTLNKQGYMSSRQVKELSERGHIIGCHTWDHHNVKKYEGDDWKLQLTEPTRQLEEITGMPIKYFAYPYGEWNMNAVKQLQKHKYVAAFQLSSKQHTTEPLYTIRRLIADGRWNATHLPAAIKRSFK